MSSELAARLPANVNSTKADARGSELKAHGCDARARQNRRSLTPLLINKVSDKLLKPNVLLVTWEEPPLHFSYLFVHDLLIDWAAISPSSGPRAQRAGVKS